MEIFFNGGKIVSAKTGNHTIITDQPVSNGGGDSAPAPFDLYLASIGTCAGIYVKSFCDRRNLSPDGIKIIQNTEFDPEERVPLRISLDIQLPPDFPEKYREAVINAAGLCLVKKSINKPPVFEITTSIKEPDQVPDVVR